ncbi:uncharacterized protein LOC119399399 [Rhipicephalus sanguineus]|uniref:uncharacterized protein LOC119399399 n=1 Tax=Rhipicephalus sanguineus TaxID=34632 RepID=UPI0018960D69|nr:uncharacterized protein LOC119399399 [Rhipicephalus sanguineus]
MSPVLFVLALLVPAAFASLPTGGNCINVTLPGILNLGQCFGTSLNFCSTSASGLVTALTKLLSCLFTPLTSTSGLGALTAFTDVITIVLRTIGFGSVLTSVQSALTPLCALGGSTVVPGCTTLLTGNQTCSAPISISLPDTFNVSRCLNQTLLLCQSGSQATDQLLLNVINTITCLLTSVITTNPGTSINGLVCLVSRMLQAVPGLNLFTFFLGLAFNCP